MTRQPSIAVDLRATLGAPTGIGTYTRSLLEALARQGKFELLGLAHRPPADDAWLQAAGIRFEAQRAPSGVVWQQWQLPKRLAGDDVDLFWSPIQTLPARSSVPCVVTVHDLTTLLMPETHRLKVRWSQLPFFGRTMALARFVVADSESTADDVRRFFPEATDRVRVVHLGIDDDFAPGDPERDARVRAGLGAPDGYVLYAGTLEPRKNLDVLLDAWEALKTEHPATPPLVLAGPYGWKSRSLVRRVERLRPLGVSSLGPLTRERLVEVMGAARLFVYPSLYEGFGLPPLEAMACGVPTIVSSGGSLPEVVGDGAAIVDPTDASALATAMQRLLEHPDQASALAARGRARAATFTWQRSAERLSSLFTTALANGAPK